MTSSPSLVLRAGVDAVFHTVLLFSVYLLFVGHNDPGGGFVGGLVAGAAFVLRAAADGPDRRRTGPQVAPATLFGLGLLTSAATGLVPLLLGDAFLESATWSLDAPVLGTVKASSTLFFDIGVYLVVVGLVLMVLEVLGAEGDADDTDDEAGTAP